MTEGNAASSRRGDLARARVWAVAYRVALVALVIMGVFFRSRRYFLDPLGLWMDEAMWGMRVFTRPLTQLEFRPIGYMALTKLIVKVYCDERTLRLLSYIAGVASVLLAVDLAKHLFASRWVRVLCVAVVAYQPLLIDMAREFKPYSVEFCVHLSLVWLFVRWRASGSRAWLTALLVSAALAFPFAYNVVFLLPGLFTLLGYSFLRSKARRALFATLLAGASALALMAALYLVAFRGTTEDSDGTAQFWGKKYDVFYLPAAGHPPSALARVRWLARKYADLAALPGSHGNRPLEVKQALTEATRKLGEVSAQAWLVLHVVGLLALLACRREQLLLLAGPLLVSVAFNACKLWPFGVFRGNVFLLVYLILIPLVGLDLLLAGRFRFARGAGALGTAWLLIASLSAGFEPRTRKRFFSSQTEMGSLIARMTEIRAQQPSALRNQPTLALFDNATCTPFIFDARYNDTIKRAFGSLEQAFDVHCVASAAASGKLLRRASGQAFFAVIGDDRYTAAYRHVLSAQAKIIDRESVRGDEDLYFAIAH